MEKNTANTNEGYYGEPADQHITSRSSNQGHMPGGFYAVGQHAGSQTSIQMQALGPAPQGNVQYVIQPVQQGYVTSTVQNHVPGIQYIVRDSVTPMPAVEDPDGPTIIPSLAGIIFKRVVSALFILLDVCLNWLQFASWVGHFELPAWLSLLETANSLKGKSPWKAQCSEGSVDLTSIYGTFVGIGTAYACLRIVNMIGETLLEYQLRNTSEKEPACRGFQLLHGWIETVLGVLCDDLPQAILLTLFSVQCQVDLTAMTKLIVLTIIKSIKNAFRASSCKQKYKPCCHDLCKDCCAVTQDFPCCCRYFTFRPFGCCCDAECLECEEYAMCPDCVCRRDNRCFGNIEKDPKWAFRYYEKLQQYYFTLQVAIIVICLLKKFSILPETIGF